MSLSIWGSPTKLHYAGTLITPEGESFHRPLHHHPDLTELLLFSKGEGRFFIDGEWYDIKPHSLIVYNRGIWHEEFGLCRVTIHYMGFSNFSLCGVPAGYFISQHKPCVIPMDGTYMNLARRFKELEESMNSSSNDVYGITSCLLMLLLSEVLAYIDTPTLATSRKKLPKSTQTISSVKRYIEEHYHEPLSLDQLSHSYYIDKYYLCRRFRAEIGVSPMQYLISYRMSVAKYYLRTTEESIQNIAEHVGYNSVTHFQNAFKKMVGLTPGQFRISTHRHS